MKDPWFVHPARSWQDVLLNILLVVAHNFYKLATAPYVAPSIYGVLLLPESGCFYSLLKV